MRFRTTPALLTAVILVAACADAPTATFQSDALQPGGPSFAHESNNQAGLSGTQNGNAITGNAIINYVAGRDGWQSTVTLQGDLAPGTYTLFAIGGPGGVQPVCSFTVDGSGGRQGCSADTDLGGFRFAEVRYQDGTVVARGTFERRGGQRDR